MSQTSCSRADAVKALRQNDGDIVNAILDFSGFVRKQAPRFGL